ncbi:MAG: hypothetical protein Gaeavirus11_21 [Gaeavirus sp.]|uniref:Uncharacterized protein n=1 Tax=Gaeavirus sp. TaxID=2487767 RepID=A0A3G5A1S9_9VIRU|nr:MAG: hypothetical protein Gaeavirus11_21 [Gaeavirus sp.]
MEEGRTLSDATKNKVESCILNLMVINELSTTHSDIIIPVSIIENNIDIATQALTNTNTNTNYVPSTPYSELHKKPDYDVYLDKATKLKSEHLLIVFKDNYLAYTNNNYRYRGDPDLIPPNVISIMYMECMYLFQNKIFVLEIYNNVLKHLYPLFDHSSCDPELGEHGFSLFMI